jgi:hypothetical protein
MLHGLHAEPREWQVGGKGEYFTHSSAISVDNSKRTVPCSRAFKSSPVRITADHKPRSYLDFPTLGTDESLVPWEERNPSGWIQTRKAVSSAGRFVVNPVCSNTLEHPDVVSPASAPRFSALHSTVRKHKVLVPVSRS